MSDEITFTRDLELLTRAISAHADRLGSCSAEEWLANPGNLVVTDGVNLVMLDRNPDGVYTGHYLFADRGRKALTVARHMVDFIFQRTDIPYLRGLTPLTNLAARWFTRQLGFTSHGAINTIDGPCELFILTRKHYG